MLKYASQSLHFLRAFQQGLDMAKIRWIRNKSQSLHFLRAFQRRIRKRSNCSGCCRNPFIFLGHFNEIEDLKRQLALLQSRNPFIFLGHFNERNRKAPPGVREGRNPFIFLGHFNEWSFKLWTDVHSEWSQSLHFLRAFQLTATSERVEVTVQCRNTFIFLGHFNGSGMVKSYKIYLSGRNPFIFLGHFNNSELTPVPLVAVRVAIPSFS